MNTSMIVYRLFDVADEINLDLVQALWTSRNKIASRLRLDRISTKSITFKDPPVLVELGSHEMELGGKTCMPAALESVGGHPACAKIVLKQGMYHQIKRMFKKHGITVLELKRIAMGALELDENLAPGQARYIGKEELSLVKKARNMCDNR